MTNKTINIVNFIFGALAVLLLGTFIYIIIAYRSTKVERPTPTIVGYRELVEENGEYSVYRNCEYRLESVEYDTVPKRVLSTIETPAVKTHPIPDRVDLNEIFDPRHEGETDWNYTEIDDEDLRYLDSLGIYWDGELGCYRKHK